MATRVKEKALRHKENDDKRPSATARYIRMSPRKVRAVINLIREKAVGEAQAILANTPRGATEPVLKVLNSAAANAENNLGMNRDNLYVAEVYANEGPTLKRFRPRAHGRAAKIMKRTSHITIILDEKN